MASEDHQDGGVSFALPPDVDDWIRTEADRRGETREEMCRQMVVAAHHVSADDGLDPGAELVDRSEIEFLEGALDAQREGFIDLIEDVRSRVVQVKPDDDSGESDTTIADLLGERLRPPSSELHSSGGRTEESRPRSKLGRGGFCARSRSVLRCSSVTTVAR
ncbi:hypothetical protein EA462_08205 [Natrarchaeobius halalkaliphilus]|uniref:Ribbon-helix-helix protein, CopG family n=1 Tax=Natrarchaeobius halalkaliphilus TaxID=1679091 RepID=A0A3N6NYP5_9EURY|nr:hypothetical protein [Natrarchaeobius halalkaliphilus]RQG89979.1 hypothetical protein EA462_08205 [Natrarchaeobius halalkaliphilus]